MGFFVEFEGKMGGVGKGNSRFTQGFRSRGFLVLGCSNYRLKCSFLVIEFSLRWAQGRLPLRTPLKGCTLKNPALLGTGNDALRLDISANVFGSEVGLRHKLD